MRKNNLRQRIWNNKAGVPPIVSLLTTVGFVVAVVIVIWYVYFTTQQASNQVILQAVDEPVVIHLPTGWYLYITLKNIGTKSIPSGTSYRVVLADLGESNTQTLSQDFAPGVSITFKIPLSPVTIPTNTYKVEGKIIFEGYASFSFTARVSRGG